MISWLCVLISDNTRILRFWILSIRGSTLAASCMMLLTMACSSSGTYELLIIEAIPDELQFPPTEQPSVQVTSAHEPLTATPVATLGVTATRQPTVQILPLIPTVEATFGVLLPANIVVVTPTPQLPIFHCCRLQRQRQ